MSRLAAIASRRGAARRWRRWPRRTRPDARGRADAVVGLRWPLAGACCGALAGAIGFAPAAWFGDAVAALSRDRLQFAAASGSVWNGSAVVVLAGGQGSRDAAALPGRIEWRIRPGLGRLNLALSHACCLNGELRLALAPRLDGFELTQLAPPGSEPSPSTAAPPVAIGHWPASLLSGLGAPWNTLKVDAGISLRGAGLTIASTRSGMRFAGRAELVVSHASSRVSMLPSLGSWRLAADGEHGEAALRLSTIEGPLKLSGNGVWTGSVLRLRGQAEAEAGSEAALSNLLNIIGRRDGARSIIAIG